MKRALSTLLLVIFALVCTCGIKADKDATQPQDSLTVGFITCAPGPEIFELYGHEAVRVSGRVDGQPVDLVFNYGLFDFSSPGFVYRFVKGETDYFSAAEPTELFMYSYMNRGSEVRERLLPLSQAEAKELYLRLCEDIKPANRTYRYKYFTENCATKPLKHLDEVTGGRLCLKKEACTQTYRDLLRQYNEGYPWYQFGIDLVLGSMLDQPIDARQSAFIPVELDKTYFNGLPERVLYEGRGDMRQPATSWLLSPMFISICILAATVLFTVMKWRSRVVYTLWFLLQGLAGILVFYLTFFSVHEGTSPNLLAWWLNPLWLAIPVLVWIPRLRRVSDTLLTADAAVTGVLLLIWPFTAQCTDPAVFILMSTTLILSISRRY